MAGFSDILDRYIAGPNQALNTQLGVARLNAQCQQNLIANQLAREQFEYGKQQDFLTNRENQKRTSFLEAANTRAQQTQDRTIAAEDRLKDARLVEQVLGDLDRPLTVQDALNPQNAQALEALSRIPGVVRDAQGKIERIVVVPGTENREGGPLYSIEFNNGTSTGPVTSLRGRDNNEFVQFYEESEINALLNRAANVAREELGYLPRGIADGIRSQVEAGREAEQDSISEIINTRSVNSETMGTTAPAADQSAAPVGNTADTQYFRTPGSTANAPVLGSPASATTTQNAAPATANTTQPTQQTGQTVDDIDADIAALQQLRSMYARGLAGVAQGPGGMYGGVNVSPGARVQEVDEQIAQLEQQRANLISPQGATTTTAASTTTTSNSAPTSTGATTATSVAPLGAPSMQGYMPYGYGTEERVNRMVSNLTAPFLQTQRSATEAYNNAASFTGREDLSNRDIILADRARALGTLTNNQMASLIGEGSLDGSRTTRAASRMSEARQIATNAGDNARAVTTNVLDNNRQVVTGAQTQAGQDYRKRMDIAADLQKDANEWARGQNERDRKAYQQLRDDVMPQILNQLQVPDERRDVVAGSVQYIWSTLPARLRNKLSDPNNVLFQNRVALKAASAVTQFEKYNNGAPLQADGFIDWIQGRFPLLNDWVRTDFNPNTTSGTVFTAYAMSGLSPMDFASEVIEPLAAAIGQINPSDYNLLMGGIINFEDKNGRPPNQDDIRKLVANVPGMN